MKTIELSDAAYEKLTKLLYWMDEYHDKEYAPELVEVAQWIDGAHEVKINIKK